MLATPETTASSQNLSKITSKTKASFRSAAKRHKPFHLIATSPSRPKDLAKTTRRVGAIGIVAIAAPATLGFMAPPQPLGSTQSKFPLEMIMLATSQRIGKIGTGAGPLVTTVTKRAILPTNALSPTSQKTSIGLGNLFIGD